jgi:hypothetical protein
VSNMAFITPLGFVTLSAFSCGECSGQHVSCGGGCPAQVRNEPARSSLKAVGAANDVDG